MAWLIRIDFHWFALICDDLLQLGGQADLWTAQSRSNEPTTAPKSIPKLIAIDNDTQKVIGDWGPRPSTATTLVDEYKQQYGTLTPEFKQDLQVWYNKDKGQDTLKDLLKLLV